MVKYVVNSGDIIYSGSAVSNITSSYAVTASFALNGGGGGGGGTSSGNFVVTASGANDNTTASYALTSSFALNGGGTDLSLLYYYLNFT
jgi:hypothetical protein